MTNVINATLVAIAIASAMLWLICLPYQTEERTDHDKDDS